MSGEGVMRNKWRIAATAALIALMMPTLGTSPSRAEPRAHVYLLRGLLNIFSLGMDTLSEELQKRGVYATVSNHTEWQGLADQAAARYKAGTEGPIILIGHSLGADAVMEMAAYLGRKGIPVALVVPFDGTASYPAPPNVARVLNLTQRDYAYMTRGAGFHGTLTNMDVSGDPNIGHISIDKSPRLHARVISEVLAVIGRKVQPPGSLPGAKPTVVSHHAPPGEEGAKPAGTPGAEVKPETPPETPAKPGNGATNATALKPLADSGVPVIALPEQGHAGSSGASSVAPAAPPHKPVPSSDSAIGVPN
jgi:Thioesterase domain